MVFFLTSLFVCRCFLVDPVDAKAYILGDANTTQIVNLEQPATVRCLAGGHPKPFVSWWKGTDLLPLKTTRFEQTKDFSLVFYKIELSDLGPYICQAWSGAGKPVSKYVTLKAIGPVHPSTDNDRQYLKYIVDAPLQPQVPHVPHPPHVYYPEVVHPRPSPRVPVAYEPSPQPEVGK